MLRMCSKEISSRFSRTRLNLLLLCGCYNESGWGNAAGDDMHKLHALWHWPSVALAIPGAGFSAVGKEAMWLTGYIGLLARNSCLMVLALGSVIWIYDPYYLALCLNLFAWLFVIFVISSLVYLGLKLIEVISSAPVGHSD